MKKTLIALATVASLATVSGNVFAQVTITGEFAYGFLASNTNGVDTSGAGIDTSQLVVNAKEDLGSGMSIAAKMSFNVGEYNVGAKADDQSLTLATPMGSLSLLTYKPGNWVMGASGSGTWYGLDGKNLGARAQRDGYALSIPLSTALSVTAAYTEPAGSTGEGAGSAGQVKQGIANISGKYVAGPAVIQAAYLAYSNAGSTDATADAVTRLGGTYDLGVAKVGAAFQMAKGSGGGRDNETAYSVSAPVAGNLSVAATYAVRDYTCGTAALCSNATATRNGYQVQAQYNLSKTAYLIASYGSWTGQTTTNPNAYALSTTTGAVSQATAYNVTTTDAKDSTNMAITLVKDF